MPRGELDETGSLFEHQLPGFEASLGCSYILLRFGQLALELVAFLESVFQPFLCISN